MSQNAQAHSFRSWCSLLSFVLRGTKNIYLVICMTREDFIQSFVSEASAPSHDLQSEKLIWSILHPSLRTVKATQQTHLIFAPSLMHLRAFLSTLPEDAAQHSAGTIGADKGVRAAPVLAIVNLFDLHRANSEFSAQGVSRTLALAVDVAARTGSQLNVFELAEPSGAHSTDPIEQQVWEPWSQNVPLLDNSVRSHGGDDQVWAGRTVEYGRLLRTWCQLETPRPS